MASTKDPNNSPVSLTKEEEILIEELKLCQKYFQQSADIAPLLAEVSVFYDQLRILIGCIQKISVELELPIKEIIQDISISLLRVNASCFLQPDGQLLCSTAFCSTLRKVMKVDKLDDLFTSYLTANDYVCIEFNNVSHTIFIENGDLFKVSLCYGILQSGAILWIYGDGSNLPFIMFDLLEELCMKYSKVTSISFKTLVVWLNKVTLDLKLSLSVDILKRIFSIINSNWECPLHSVREQNAKGFELFLSACSLRSLHSSECNDDDDSAFQSPTNLICHIMREQSWKMKSKYTMLSLLLEQYGVKKGFAEFPNLVHGLISSLSHSHLTTAGSDMYRNIVKNLHVDDWIDIFLIPITRVLIDSSVVSIEKQNLFNYWIPVTLKLFPSLLNILLAQLIDVSDSVFCESKIFAIVSLLKLGRKSSTLLSVWNEEFTISTLTYGDFLNFLQYALEHFNEAIRAEAFAVVCCSTKTRVIPSVTEFQLVKKFLQNNISIDSALLRQSVLNSFTLFLVRVLDSSINKMERKNEQNVNKLETEFFSSKTFKNCNANDVLQNINFLEWLFYFLSSNLEPGVNYQRKVLSLKLFKIILAYFEGASEEVKCKTDKKENGIDQRKRRKVMEYAVNHGKWHFNSARSCRILLSCVLDPTDDIREMAALILTEYFSLQQFFLENSGLLHFALELCTSPVFYETESGALLFKVIATWTYKIPKNVSEEFISNVIESKYEKCVQQRYGITEDQTDCKFQMNTNNICRSSLVYNDLKILVAALYQIVNSSSQENNISEVSNLKVMAKIPEGMGKDISVGEPSVIDATNSFQLPKETGTVEIEKVEHTCVKPNEDENCNPSKNENATNKNDVEEKLDYVETGIFPKCSDSSLPTSIVCKEKPQIHRNDIFDRLHKTNLEGKVTEEKIRISAAPLSVFLLSHAEKQLSNLKSDIFQAVSTGSPLHGTLGALAQLCIHANGPEFGCMSVVEIDKTISLLEDIVSYLLNLLSVKSVTTNDIAPSFAEMDQAIKFSLEKSVMCLETSKEEDTHLSPAHQLVLNCIWRNLKICCTLASGLPCNKECNISIVKRCASVITQILTRCRHKGAIESAGVALSSFVKTIKSCHSFDWDIHLILRGLLQQFLQSFECSSGKGSVTRRSAGLSILLQKIVTSDTQPGKPLLEMCISQLLNIANTPVHSKVAADPEAVLTDLPQAQSLHFLRVLVQDSSLKQDIAPYMSTIAIVCFTNFTSPLWTIRNAALQLSGTLIPKLVGQKKIQDEEVTLGSNISAEAFFTHFPELTDFILTSLQKATNCHQSETLRQHADLIPMLSLLAKITIGVETFINLPLLKKICQCRDCFLQLLDSPIYQVRNLAAKTYERFMPFTKTYEAIVFLIGKLNTHSDNCNGGDWRCSHEQNRVNGILLALKYLVEKLKFESENVTEVESYLSNISTFLKNTVKGDVVCHLCTYFNQLLFIELVDEVETFQSDCGYKRILEVHRILKEEKIQPSFKPGLFLWAAKVIEQAIENCCPQYLVTVWYNSYVLFNIYPEIVKSSVSSLKWRTETDKSLDGSVKSSLLIAILKIMLEMTEEYLFYTLTPLFSVMLLLLQDSEVNVIITLKEVKTVSSWCFSETFRCNIITLPVVTGLLSRHLALTPSVPDSDLKFILELLKSVKDRSEAIQYDEDYRLNISKSVNLLAPSLQAVFVPALRTCEEVSRKEMLRDIIEILLNILLDLLQDEDYDVRKEAAKFISMSEDMTGRLEQNPYSSLQDILQPSTLLSLLPYTYATEFLWDKLCYENELREIVKCKDNKDYNVCSITSPFDLGINNIYKEETKMVDLYGSSFLHFLQEANPSEKRKLKEIVHKKSFSFRDDVTTVLPILSTIQKYGIPSTSPEHTVIYILAKKIIYVSKLMASLKVMTSDIESVIQDLKDLLASGID